MSEKSNKGEARPEGTSAEPQQLEAAVEEKSEGTLAPNPELEEALREAAAAISDSEDAGEEPSGPEVSEQDAERLNDELAELEARNLRLLADYENFRKRALRERQEAGRYGSQNLIKDLLSVVDNLDRAIDHARQSEGGDLQSLLQGVELVQREFTAVLAKHHVIEIEAQGKAFNPALHEAMAQIDGDGAEPNTIVDVLEKGYQLHDRLVRPSRVVVARGREEEAEADVGEDEENAD